MTTTPEMRTSPEKRARARAKSANERARDAQPALALRALEAAREGDANLESITQGKQPSSFDWLLAKAHLLGVADATPGDLEITLAIGLVAIGAARGWSAEAAEARAAAMRSAQLVADSRRPDGPP